MGFQGTLDSVNIADIFQTLAANAQTGTLSVDSPSGKRHVWFQRGTLVMVDSPIREGLPQLLHSLVARGFIKHAQGEQLFFRCNNTRQPLRDLVLASGFVGADELDEVSSTLIEDLVCEIFEWPTGSFRFTDGDPLPELESAHAVAMGDVPIQTAGVVMEATRRQDEWARIREAIPDSDELFVVDNDGRAQLNQLDPDPDMLKVLRYCDGKHQLADMSEQAGLSRFDIHAIVAQFVMAGIVRRRNAEEVVNDALELREQGHIKQACSLLENARKRCPTIAVLGPLAEMRVELRQIPPAVELYLEMVQLCQADRDFAAALDFLDTVIELSPDDPELRLDRATILIELNRLPEAADSFIAAATDYLQIRDTGAAIDCCHRARDILPRSPQPHRLLARAYLLDGQTDNAVVEYKSLWHALLTERRPRKALTELETILQEDCKYPTVTDQVLNHAKGSEAVKTASAIRMLVYLVILILMIGAGFVGKELIDTYILLERAKDDLQALRPRLQESETVNHANLLEQLETIGARSRDEGFRNDVDALRRDIESAWSRVAQQAAQRFEEALSTQAFDEAGQILQTLRQRHAIPLSDRIPEFQEQLEGLRARHRLADDREAIEQLWNDLSWNTAIEQLATLIETSEPIPTALREELEEQLQSWRDQAGSAEHLYRRAERIEVKSGRQAAIEAFTLALSGQGEAYRTRAQERLIVMEQELAQDMAQTIHRAAQAKDADRTFDTLNELNQLVASAQGDHPRSILESLLLPCTIQVSSPHTTVTITRSSGNPETIRAPDDHEGPWEHAVLYPATGSITIGAERTGFVPLNDRTFDASKEALSTAISLERGPQWRTALPAAPRYAPQSTGGQLLVPLVNNRLAAVDLNLGTSLVISIDQEVGSMPGAPVLFQRVAYLAIADRINAIDMSTRSLLWSWPPSDDPTAVGTFASSVWVQYHDLISDAIQIFAGTTNGTIVSVAVRHGTVTPYPPTALGRTITGPLFADSYKGLHSTLFVPAGNQLLAFDAASVSEQTPLSFRFRLDTRGEITARPVRTRVSGREAILVADSSGTVTAIAADPTVHSNPMEAMGSWPVQGEVVGEPVIHRDGRLALVATRNGMIFALDLQRPGEIVWRYGEGGTIGRPVGSPACGSYGVFLADANGMLVCLDITTGRKLWDYDLGAPAATGPITIDDRVIVANTAGSLFCFLQGAP